ncbi:hypothetical protein B0H21DRAFT_696827, partial [Amylocystis lapponica]
EHYGVWASDVTSPLKPGGHVKMTASKLRKQCLGNPEQTVLVMSFGGYTIGHAFASRWEYGDVMQLVVDTNQRKRYIATNLLQNVKHHPWFAPVTIIGVASSHPAACNAVAKVALLIHSQGLGTAKIDTDFIAQHGAAVLQCTTVEYLKGARLCGSLFGEDRSDGAVSLVNTNYFIDHAEPKEALKQYFEENKWHLGQLRDGHEFFYDPVTSSGRAFSHSALGRHTLVTRNMSLRKPSPYANDCTISATLA